MMQAVRCHRFAGLDDGGQPAEQPAPLREVLSLEQIPVPAISEGEVLLAVHYAGIQYPDVLQVQGFYQEKPPLPYIPGADVSGVVLETGPGVTNLHAGDRVTAVLRVGGLAEKATAPATRVWKVPDAVPLSACANIGRNYLAAYHSLKVVGEITDGDLVLVDGASGGVGMATIQLAKAMGAQVIAAVSRDEKKTEPAEVGADRVLTYGTTTETYRSFKNEVKTAAADLGHPHGVDLVVDVVQGDLFEAALVSSVRPLGRIALVGFTGGQKPIRPGLLLIKQAAVVGSLWAAWARVHPEDHARHVQEILDFLASGAIEPRADRIFPLTEYLKAFELYENNLGRGNTVIRVTGEQ